VKGSLVMGITKEIEHVAIMMDGNGRWATKRGLPRLAGHYAGMKTILLEAITSNQITNEEG